MAPKEPLYKNTYIIDMDRVLKNRTTWSVSGANLPVLQKNDKPDTSIKELSERCVRKMIKQFDQLSKIIGKTGASTIIEYLDTNGKPVITLYPTNDIDVHNTDWTNFSSHAMADLQRVHDERMILINRARNQSNGK